VVLERVGGYELIEKVASGGMAEVFRARAIRSSGVSKIVCLKRIHPTLCADPTFVRMFIEEARLGLSLSHANIVPVFDFGCIDGRHFLVMEYVEGQDLSELLARTKIVEASFDATLAVHITRQVLEGLTYAHDKRDEDGKALELVHRDISPSNIVVSTTGEVRILDFGIARSALREFRTRTGVIKGKPGYMPPEQETGGAVDARTDIFSCGILLHETLSLDRPGKGGQGITPSYGEHDAGEMLERVVSRATAPNREDRFGSAASMAKALDDYLDEVGARPNAAALASHVLEVFEARAPTPDWSVSDSAFDKHLAEMVPDTAESEASETASEVTPATDVTLDLSKSEPQQDPRKSPLPVEGGSSGRQRRGWILAFLAFVLIGSVGAFVLISGGDEEARGSQTRAEPISPAEPPRSARVDVRTEPAGASVRIDGAALEGITPLSTEIEAGDHIIELELAGHVLVRRAVAAESGQLVVLEIGLTRAAGALRVVTEPEGARVAIDSRPIGEAPALLRNLDRDRRYRVDVTKVGYEAWSEVVELDEHEITEVRVELSRTVAVREEPGLLTVSASPWAEVILDGHNLGMTPIVGRQVPSGRHDVVLRNTPRGVSARRVVMITAGQESRVFVDLAREPTESGDSSP